MAVLPTGIGPVTGGYQIERSLRFNSADSAYLNRTPASAGNRKIWTWSGWVKRSALGSSQILFQAGTDGNNFLYGAYFNSSDQLVFSDGAQGGGSLCARTTSAVFRDVGAWYHVVVSFNAASTTVTLYVNNVAQTATGTQPSNVDYAINNTVEHRIGRAWGVNTSYFNGYLTEVNFIDGQALTPSSFGETDSATGVWKPKAFSGTYGTNGFYLKFADNSGTTSTTLGKDSSGNGNNWTPNNFSVTAGAGNDSMVDTPTAYGTDTGVGGEVRGNYATLNPLKIYGANFTYSNGNLQVTDSSASYVASIPTLTPPNSGKWYWEVTVLSQTTASTIILGLATEANAYSTNAGTMASYGRYRSDGDISNLAGTTQTAGSSYTTNDVIGVALDVDSGTVRFYKNGAAQGATPSFSFTAGTVLVPYVVGDNTAGTKTLAVNFGQRAFAYTAPSGFKALCTQNLPTPTIGATSTTQANRYFDVVTRSANGSQVSISSLQFSPDFLWGKARSAANAHGLIDRVRGATKYLSSNNTDAEATSTNGTLVSFDSNGYTLQADTFGLLNYTGRTYVDWLWRANGAGSTNTAGTITSTVSANTTSGFSIVTYTGNGTSGATIGHGLGAVPSFYIVKNRGSINKDWECYHISLGNTNRIRLNQTAAADTGGTMWANTTPTSTVFSVGVDADVNASTNTYVAYCFAPVAGYSAFGSYTGNGSTDGVFVYTGFRPRYLLIKETGNINSWEVYDTARNEYNVQTQRLFPNDSQAEATTNPSLDILSNGFKCRAGNTGINRSGGTYIYAAFAESPFKYALAR